MMTEQGPSDPDTRTPPTEDDEQPSPFDRPPFDKDPEAQHAPGINEQDRGSQQTPPPMQAAERTGNDNIRQGRVGGVMGAPASTNGQGQGD